MRLTITKNKNSSSFYVIKSVTIDGKRTSIYISSIRVIGIIMPKYDETQKYYYIGLK